MCVIEGFTLCWKVVGTQGQNIQKKCFSHNVTTGLYKVRVNNNSKNRASNSFNLICKLTFHAIHFSMYTFYQ